MKATRRQFMKGSATLAATAALTGCRLVVLPCETGPRSAEALSNTSQTRSETTAALTGK